MSEEKALIFEMSKPGRTAYSLPHPMFLPRRHRSGFPKACSGKLRRNCRRSPSWI